MKKNLFFVAIFSFIFTENIYAQSTLNNGQLDDISEFTTKFTVPLVMPDGVKLFTDFYVPRTRDSLSVDLLGFKIEMIPKGSQILLYDTLNGQPNPNPYQLPTVFTRTPYNKGRPDEYDAIGSIMAILGYNYMLQDMRGRYTSGGIYFPMYSDSWNKNGYHPNYSHILDPYPLSDPRNGNRHEDGYNSVKQIAIIDSAYIAQYGDSLAKAVFLTYYKGYQHTNTRLNNGSIGMIGASALGNTQLQLALAHRVMDSIPQLKCLLPIVATTEHYLSTGYSNGVFRNRIVTGWLKGQIFSGTDDDLNAIDEASGPGYRDNSIHSSSDYLLPQPYTVNGVTRIAQKNKFEGANISIDHFSTIRYPWYTQPGYTNDPMSPSGYYPNSLGRADMDGSVAPVDADGEAVDGATQLPRPNLNYSRYTNLQCGVLHLTGWWDIFTDGQIRTLQFAQEAVADSFKRLQKIIIGPWAHQTIGSRITGDRTYPETVNDLTKIDLGNVNVNNVPIGQLISSDLVTWFRYNLNYKSDQKIGEPKFVIRAGTRWQNFLLGKQIRIPATDFIVPFPQMINFLAGKGTLSNINYAERDNPSDTSETVKSIPLPLSLGSSGGLGFSDSIPASGIPYTDFRNDVPTFRLYIAGPDAAADAAAGVTGNEKVGNYWVGTDRFPPCENIRTKPYYLHADGSINESAPSVDEGFRVYVHDPNDPILTVGGSNMIVRSPDGTRDSQGQMEWTDPTNAPYTMDREGVIKFTSEPVQDSISILGIPRVKLFAKTNPAGVLDNQPTNTDWIVRIGDQFPDGRIYYVTEAVVGARARAYAKAIMDGVESPQDIIIPYENIMSGQVIDYDFEGLPIGYAWGKGHKVVVLISSSSFTRFMVNPNLPLNDGEFFRRNPGDGQTYIFNGVEMTPRIAVQRVHFSPDHPTQIIFPTIDNTLAGSCAEYSGPTSISEIKALNFDVSLFPNPSSDMIHLFANKPSKSNYEVVISNAIGTLIDTKQFDDNVVLNIENYSSGIYFATVRDKSNNEAKVTKKFVKN
jgi:predicted acyl esterase